ncbi:hypothetical protein GCM10027269_42400 [Kribbella endophytica]
MGTWCQPQSGSTVNTILAHVTERLEAVLPDGSDDFMISIEGDVIVEDLAIVLSFAECNLYARPCEGRSIDPQPIGLAP